MDRPVLKLGSRGSLLATTQARQVIALLEPFLGGRKIELVIITTSGDKAVDTPLAQSGGKGLFIKEIENELLAGRIDLAVHSAKDMPTEIPPGLVIAATPPRQPPNDVWIGHAGLALADLPPGSVVGTSSPRRQVQVLARRPDIRVVPLRGNIDTRLKKVRDGVVAGTLLAQAGLMRADMLPPEGLILSCEEFIPAAGQGTLAIEARWDDELVCTLAKSIHHRPTFWALDFERKIVQALAGNCMAPIGVCAQQRGVVDGVAQAGWIVRALLATPDGRHIARGTLLTKKPSAAGLNAMVRPLLEMLQSRGSDEILAQIAAHGR